MSVQHPFRPATVPAPPAGLLGDLRRRGLLAERPPRLHDLKRDSTVPRHPRRLAARVNSARRQVPDPQRLARLARHTAWRFEHPIHDAEDLSRRGTGDLWTLPYRSTWKRRAGGASPIA